MPREYPRTVRVGEQIHRELAHLVTVAVKDPEVGMVTILDADVSRDFAHAKVYFSVLGDDASVRASASGLNRAAGFLRRELGRRLRLRTVPQLRFVYDDTQRKGARIDALIDRALAEDAGPRAPEE
ncbi:MAG: 30S ribosome-binding factor RbfA [Gammaproteobacteria bacterium]|nr:30S ribosome-binding factor RbfA [Gammaproteobacteria bacterium]MBA3730830.1 30S ribosome-binding factor RbfA [Gammaproteobacteria bacterium]